MAHYQLTKTEKENNLISSTEGLSRIAQNNDNRDKDDINLKEGNISNIQYNEIQPSIITNQELNIDNNRQINNNNNNTNNNTRINNNAETSRRATSEQTEGQGNSNTQYNQSQECYGDDMDDKNEDVLRFVNININNIPESSKAPKNQILFQAINNSQADIVGMTEIGRCWHHVNETNDGEKELKDGGRQVNLPSHIM